MLDCPFALFRHLFSLHYNDQIFKESQIVIKLDLGLMEVQDMSIEMFNRNFFIFLNPKPNPQLGYILLIEILDQIGKVIFNLGLDSFSLDLALVFCLVLVCQKQICHE